MLQQLKEAATQLNDGLISVLEFRNRLILITCGHAVDKTDETITKEETDELYELARRYQAL